MKICMDRRIIKIFQEIAPKLEYGLRIYHLIITQKQFERMLHIFSHLSSIDLRYCDLINFNSVIKINTRSRFSITCIRIDDCNIDQQTLDFIARGIVTHSDFADSLVRNRNNNYSNIVAQRIVEIQGEN